MTDTTRDGGIKIVFDVLEDEAAVVARIVRNAGFDVHRYYHPADEHRRGGSDAGMIRLGAGRSRRFVPDEVQTVEADFDAAARAAGFRCERVGTDTYETGGPGPAGVREPRRPRPTPSTGAARVDSVPADRTSF